MPTVCLRSFTSHARLSTPDLDGANFAPLHAPDARRLTIVEVAVAGLMVGLISLSLIGLDAAGKTADQRRRAQAFQVAQADQERIKGLSADPDRKPRPDPDDHPRQRHLHREVDRPVPEQLRPDSASCSTSAAAADYAKVISTVNWTANARSPVVVQSVVTPRAGGSLLVQTVDQNAAAISGARVNVSGADQSTDAVRRFGTTDAGGCTIFGALLVGDYAVAPVLAGYVD